MTEENKETFEVETEAVDSSVEDVKTNETTEEVKADGVATDPLEDEKFIPYKRFKEINDKYKQLKDEFENLKVDASQIKNESIADVSEVDETEANEEETNPLKEKVEKYEATFNELFQSKLKQIPEAFHDLIPEGDSLSKMTWIENALNKGLFEVAKPKDFGGLGANPISEPTITREQFMKMTHSEKAKLKQEDEELYNDLLRK